MAMVQHLDAWLRRRIREEVDGAIAPRAAALSEAVDLAGAHRHRLAAVEERLKRLESDLAARTAPFSPETTVHQAWRRHPGVRAIFTRHHLPDCPACPVGEDERLEEVAFGYGIGLEGLLEELNGLLESEPAARG